MNPQLNIQFDLPNHPDQILHHKLLDIMRLVEPWREVLSLPIRRVDGQIQLDRKLIVWNLRLDVLESAKEGALVNGVDGGLEGAFDEWAYYGGDSIAKDHIVSDCNPKCSRTKKIGGG
jgi:hypothetical protein